MILLRHELGDELRRVRLRQGRTLREVSAAARVSLGYLSEVERGQKEASSELLAAICSALDVQLSALLDGVVEGVRLLEEATALDQPAVAPVPVDSASARTTLSVAGTARRRSRTAADATVAAA
jgi:transcriptional regulator with XRE-family HTH domain